MSGKTDWYGEFVDAGYKPKDEDFNFLFYFEAADGISMEDAVGRIASESSCGTWTTLTEMPNILPKIKAHAYKFGENHVKVAYPPLLFEEGSVPSLLSGPAGNIFGMKAVKNLRLLDAELPLSFVKSFKGPNYGATAIKKIFKKKSGPITAVVPKPKLGFTAREHAEKIGFAIWKGGVDCCKDDENLTDQKFNRFEERVKLLSHFRDKAEKITGDVKDAYINVTAPNMKELERRVKIVHDNGFKYFMLDVVISGFTAVQTAVDLAHDYGMAIHGHRAMHSMFTRNPKHGMSMLFLAKLMRLIGIDQLHIGTVIGKLEGKHNEIVATKEMILSKEAKEIPELRMPQKWHDIKPMMPVASGGLHAGLLPELFDIYGTTDMVIQVGGGVQALRPYIGAKSVVQAIEAYQQGTSLEEYAKTHPELKQALEKFGTTRPI